MPNLMDGKPNETSSLLPTLAGVGLFLLTTAVSQWVHSHHRLPQGERRQQSDDTDFADPRQRERDERHEDLRHLYQQRRLRDRMSYEDLSKLPNEENRPTSPTRDQNRGKSTGELGTTVDNQESANSSPPTAISWSLAHPAQNSFPDDGNSDRGVDFDGGVLASSSRPLTEWNLHLLQRRSLLQGSQNHLEQHDKHENFRLSILPSGSSDGGIVIKNKGGIANSTNGNDLLGETHPNAHYDFHPKNRNWRHFEHYNEKDRRKYELAKAAKVAAAAAKKLEEDFSANETNSTHGDERRQLNGDAEAAKRGEGEGNGVSRPGLPQPIQLDCTKESNDDQNNQDIQGLNSPWIASDEFCDDDARSISSSSQSSEEQFVWTKHQHRGSSSGTPAAATLAERISRDFKRFMENNDDISLEVAQEMSHRLPLKHIVQSSQDAEPKSVSDQLPSPYNGSDCANGTLPARRSASFSERSANAANRLQKPYSLLRRMLSLGSAVDGEAAPMKNTHGPIGIKETAKIRPRPPSNSTEVQNRRLRAEYNARIMPEKVVLIRHGQSMGNVNEVLYSTTPDNSIPLTDLGWEEAHRAGKILKEKILTPNESVHFIVSPYVRTVETFHGLVSAWCDPNGEEFASISDYDEKVKAWYRRLMELGLTWNEDSRLREQDFGNYQKPEVIKRAKEERHRFGAFYYRFPHGESASDVFDRVSTFLDSLWRSFEMNKSRNYVLVTHGIVLRVLLARYFRYTIDQFNMLANPRNCEMVVLGHSGDGKLDLEGRCALDVEEEPETQQSHVTGYKFHKRLRILPRNAIRKVKIRISPND